MSDLDLVAATKANLELLLLENRNLLEHFGGLMNTLEEIADLPSAEKQEQLSALESSGAFALNGIDIRRFHQDAGKALAPPQFLERTRRRLDNTLTLLDELTGRKSFDGAEDLREEIAAIQADPVSPEDTDSVVAFRDKLEVLRNSASFLTYMDVKNQFLKEDEAFRAEAEYVATKEAVADGEQAAQNRQAELEDIQQKMDSGELSAEDAQEAIDALQEAREEAAEEEDEPMV